MTKELCAAVAAFALFATQAVAGGPLVPGKPAGVAKAQADDDNTVLYVLGAGAIIAGIALLASDNSNYAAVNTSGGGGTTTTTSSTTT